MEVCPIELPGRGTRFGERLLTAMPAMVDLLATAIGPFLDQPFAIFGHSMGALTGYHLTQALQERYGVQPERLFVSACLPPHLDRGRLHDLPEAELVEELLRMNGTPQVLLEDADLRRVLLPVLRADLCIYETCAYREGSRVDCPVTAIAGTRDLRAEPACMTEWQRHTSAAFTLRVLEGDHFFLHSCQSELPALVSQDLDHVSRRTQAATFSAGGSIGL